MERLGWISLQRIGLWSETPDKNGPDYVGWVYGTPPETYREATIDFQGLGLTGNKLLWKANLLSGDEDCVPEVISVDVNFKASVNAIFSRSSPAVLGNVIYNGSFETPAATWTDLTLRGHEESDRLYDPEAPNLGLNVVSNWVGTAPATLPGAGQIMMDNQAGTRNLFTPENTIQQFKDKNLGNNGNGNKTLFTGTINPHPIVRSTLSITDGVEIFTASATDTLVGSMGGTGTINRSTGVYDITFNTAPSGGSKLFATYTSYALGINLPAVDFNSGSVTLGQLNLDNSQITDINGTRFVHDLDGDGVVDIPDATYLQNWVKGFRDGGTTNQKEWILPAIDRSATLVVGSPGLIPWYNGTAVTQSEKDTYDAFRCTNADRDTVAYVGSKMGMLHAFDAGKYRPYYFDEATFSAGWRNLCEYTSNDGYV